MKAAVTLLSLLILLKVNLNFGQNDGTEKDVDIPVFVDDEDDFTEAERIQHSNEFVDDLVATIRKHYGNRFDPFAVPDQRTTFEYRVSRIRFRGNARIYNGKIHGLSSLRRTGDCFVGHNETVHEFLVKARLGADDVQFLSDIEFNALFARVGRLRLNMSHIDIEMSASLKAKMKKPTISSVKVVKMTGLRVKFEDIGFLMQPLLNASTRVVLYVFKGSIIRNVENNLQVILNDILDKGDLRLGV